MFKYSSQNFQQTKNLAKILALEAIKAKKGNKALVFALVGDLGSGKTTFIQGFMKGLGIKRRITSPSFVIFKNYQLSTNNQQSTTNNYRKIYHIDVYRLRKQKDILDLGLKEILADPLNLVLIEWADKIKSVLPKNTIWIKFRHRKRENERLITISNY